MIRSLRISSTSRWSGPLEISARPSIRLYSNPPQFKSKGNLLVNSINYVKAVDNYQADLSKETTDQDLAAQLIKRISSSPELLYLLSLFHHELAQLGITPSSMVYSTGQVWRYRVAYMLKLTRIHDVFWSQCQQQEISQRTHRLGFSPTAIGVLSPSNFKLEDYHQLQKGEFGGVDFKDVQILGKRTFS